MKRVIILIGFLLTACTVPVSTPAVSPEITPVPPTAETSAPADPTPIPPIPPTPTSEPLAVLVNGEALALADYERQMVRYAASMTATGKDPDTPEGQKALIEARAWVLDRMIEQRLIVQAAHAQGIDVADEEVNAAIQSLVTDIGQETFDERLANEGLTLDEAQVQLKDEMLASSMMEQVVAAIPEHTEQVNARHIVVGTEEEARQILTQIKAGADFATLARTYSQDVFTRDRGGDLDYFPRGILTSPEVENAAFSLQPGQISDVIKSMLGYHIIQVVDRVSDMEVSPENLRQLKDKAAREWIAELWAAADVERFISVTP